MRFWVLSLCSICVCLAQTNPFAGDPRAAGNGNEVFRIYCSPCHGIRGQGGRGPDLTLGTYSAGDQDKDLFHVISAGVPGTEMSDYGHIGDENIWRVVTYIRSIARHDTAPSRGDRASGEKLFWGKGGCGQCHIVDKRGGQMGPDLTRAGRQRSLAYLRESVVAPSEDITPGYATIEIVTRDGRKISGVQRNYDNFSAQLLDAREQLHSFQRSEVSLMKREYRSLMPDSYGKMFSAAELDDLLAYLVSLRGVEEK